MGLRKVFSIILVTLSVLIISILFGQLLGGYYIYNLLVEDNLPAIENKAQVPSEERSIEKRKVLRLEPIKFYTIQVGIFPDVASAQNTVNKLTDLGLRPFVSKEKPYKIWLGCFSDYESGKNLEKQLNTKGLNAFIGEGLVNDRALKFFSSNTYMQESFSPLLGKYNIVLNHSLKMFTSPHFSQYQEKMWREMISKLQEEINIAIEDSDKISRLEISSQYEKELKKLKEAAILYSGSLNQINEAGKDETVLQSQTQLLELIAAYHNVISSTNEKLGTN